MNILRLLGMADGERFAAPPQRIVEIADPMHSAYAPATGLFDRAARAGQDVSAGDLLGEFHFITEPERPSIKINAMTPGLILAHSHRGMVNRGELLALIVQDVKDTA